MATESDAGMVPGPPDAAIRWSRPPQSDDLERRITGALSGVAPCLARHDPGVAELWILTEVEELIGDPRLSRILARGRVARRSELGAALIDPDSEPPKITADSMLTVQGRAILDAIYCDGAPSPRVTAYVARDTYVGYDLTHQLLIMAWAERRPQCRIPAAWAKRKHTLLARVRDEVAGTEGFGDLYAEQLAVLALVGDPRALERGWIERVLDHQDETGCWTEGGDVEVSEGVPLPDHTTSLAAYPLARYREALGGEEPPSPPGGM